MKQWDRDYVRTKYGSQMLGQHIVYYPCTNAKGLIVIFSSMGKDRFDRYSWFWSEDEIWTEYAYLFIKDDSFKYFLGDDDKPLTQTFRKIILHHMTLANVSCDKVYTVGGSMGGYAAVYYACLMELKGAILANPQLDYASTRAHSYQNWERSVRSTGSQWYDLHEFFYKFEKKPFIYIEYGEYRADELAAKKFIHAVMESEGLFIIRKTKWQGHTVDCLTKETILNTITYFNENGFKY
ncbi:hypothetical protein [Aeromonas veronii]|uniref:hypothetical protein n=1 Tax=Aeromonas veronii TaxID=654 RepID=UPI001F175502|nr:hypothetical protein [Aeromonas veronii]MCF5866930.1 hypothetical protein [Aeromonas veronii]